MSEQNHIKFSVILLLLFIPIFGIGYYFAVNMESLFFIFEWLLILVVITLTGISVSGFVQQKSNGRWVSLFILAFLVQFIVLALFLGPVTKSGMFYVFYFITAATISIYYLVHKKMKAYKYIKIPLLIISMLTTVYVIFLHLLWGNSLV